MNFIWTWISARLNSIRGWWSENRNEVLVRLNNALEAFDTALDRFVRGQGRMVFMAIVINIIVGNFYPEFATKCPTIYAYFNGWLQFTEFAVKYAFKGVYSLFTGELSGFMAEAQVELLELWYQFVNWIASLQF